MSTRWMFQVVEIKADFWGRRRPAEIQEEINKMGAQGWELVTVTSPGSANLTTPMYAFFKRQA